MKGISDSSLPNSNKADALQLIKDGLRYNLKSPMCWHVLGLFHRTEKQYQEAIRAYTYAVRFDKV